MFFLIFVYSLCVVSTLIPLSIAIYRERKENGKRKYDYTAILILSVLWPFTLMLALGLFIHDTRVKYKRALKDAAYWRQERQHALERCDFLERENSHIVSDQSELLNEIAFLKCQLPQNRENTIIRMNERLEELIGINEKALKYLDDAAEFGDEIDADDIRRILEGK